MNSRNMLIAIVVVLALLGGAYFALKNRPAQTPPAAEESLGLRVGPNAVAALEQRPDDRVVVSFVGLEAAGFVAIYEDRNGERGKLLGASAMLEGDAQRVEIDLDRKTRDGETLYAALYLDDGDGKFDAKADAAAQDPFGNDIVAAFTIDAEASESPPEVLL